MANYSNSSSTDTSDYESLSSSEELVWSKAAEAFLRESTQNRQIESNISFGSYFKKGKASTNTNAGAGADSDSDANGILNFITLVESACETNETGWTHDRAVQALDAKRARQRSHYNKGKSADFDFFSHFDPRLREGLRHAYERRKRFGYTGDFQPGAEESLHLLSQQSMRRLAGDISAAVATPSRESEGQVARRLREKDSEKDNLVMDDLDDLFRPTLERSSWEWSDEQDVDDA